MNKPLKVSDWSCTNKYSVFSKSFEYFYKKLLKGLAYYQKNEKLSFYDVKNEFLEKKIIKKIYIAVFNLIF
jgi:hypothetical protein